MAVKPVSAATTIVAMVFVAMRPTDTILAFTIPPVASVHVSRHPQEKQSSRTRRRTSINLYRKFHDYAWDKLLLDNNQELDTVPEELKSNASPAKAGTNVVATIKSISQFPCLSLDSDKDDESGKVLRLARSAFLETQTAENEALITNMTIHVLNFVLFPSTHIIQDGYNLGLPIFGADIVSLPGNKHLVALDFQPVLPLDNATSSSFFPEMYSHLERKLEAVHSKYQRSDSDSAPLLPWGGDIPPQAQRFFSPYALWTRLSDENAMNTVNTVVYEAFQEYTDLYLELMNAVQNDINAGKLELEAAEGLETDNNPVWKGQIDYLEYRRTNDPARPMLQRLYGNEWSENVIGNVLFPDL